MKKRRILNRSELKRLFKNNISNYKINWNEEASTIEEQMAQLVENVLKIELKRFPTINYPEEINTPDYASIKYKIAVEIKAPSSLRRGIEGAFRKSIKQTELINSNIKCITVVVIDKMLKNGLEQEIVEAILRRCFALQIPYLFVVNNGVLIRVSHMLKRSKNRATRS